MQVSAKKRSTSDQRQAFLANTAISDVPRTSSRGEGTSMSLAASEHTTKAFDFDLQELKCMVAEMGGHVEKQLLAAIDSLVKNDKEQGQKVVLGDAMLDGLQHVIEN